MSMQYLPELGLGRGEGEGDTGVGIVAFRTTLEELCAWGGGRERTSKTAEHNLTMIVLAGYTLARQACQAIYHKRSMTSL